MWTQGVVLVLALGLIFVLVLFGERQANWVAPGALLIMYALIFPVHVGAFIAASNEARPWLRSGGVLAGLLLLLLQGCGFVFHIFRTT